MASLTALMKLWRQLMKASQMSLQYLQFSNKQELSFLKARLLRRTTMVMLRTIISSVYLVGMLAAAAFAHTLLGGL